MSDEAPFLFFEIDTFASLEERGGELSDWVETVWRELLAPLVPTSDPVPYELSIGLESRSGDVEAAPQTSALWEQTLDGLRRGELQSASLTMVRGARGGEGLSAFHLEVQLCGLAWPGVSHRVSVAASRDLFGAAISIEAEDRWVRVVKAATTQFEASTGYVTFDVAGYISPFESRFHLHWPDTLREVRTYLRGYYWGNFLSADHIRALGGAERVVREAPCHLIETLAPGLMYLQLTPSVEEFDDQQLAELGEFLSPCLPAVSDEYPYLGPPVRVLDEP